MTAPATTLAGLVLAAGGAVRFGAPKQLAQFAGATLVERAALLALGSCDGGVVLVTGAFAAEVQARVASLPLRLAHNPDWSAGMAGSVRCGLDAMPAGAAGCLILLCDQVTVDAGDINRLAMAWRDDPSRIAAARFAGMLGVPAIFPAGEWGALRALRGDTGARALLAQRRGVVAVPMPHAGEDVDTPADLERLGRD